MKKTILITGSTDGIGLSAVKMLAKQGHNILVHGRSDEKVHCVVSLLENLAGGGKIDSFVWDLSTMDNVKKFAEDVKQRYDKIDVLINNAGVYTTNNEVTSEGYDVRFAVNTIAPYLLTKLLLDIMDKDGRVVNLSSAAQSTVDLDAIKAYTGLSAREAYAQSKLALTMWSRYLAQELDGNGPLVVSVNPKSLLGSKMVREAYGIAGGDVDLGGDILFRAALSDEFEDANGRYFDNDREMFAMPHPDAMDDELCEKLVNTLEEII